MRPAKICPRIIETVTNYQLACVGIVGLTAAVASLLTIWAAFSRRHWFWRVLVVWGIGAAMLPIRAFEPALVLWLAIPFTCLILASIRRFQTSHDNALPRLRKSLVQFRLLDAVLVTTIVGCLLASGLYFAREIMNRPNWQEIEPAAIFYPALAFSVMTLLGWCTVHGPLPNLAATGLVIAIPSLTMLLWPEAHWLYELDSDLGGIFAGADNSDAFVVTASGLIAFATVIISAMLLNSFRRRDNLAGRSSRFILTYGGALSLMVLCAFYFAMLGRSPFPPTIVKRPNHYAEIMKIAERVKQLNEAELPLETWQTTNPVVAQDLSSLYDELIELANADNVLPFDHSMDADRIRHDKTVTDRISTLRTLCDALEAEAKSLGDRGDISSAIQISLANVRLGAMLCQNSVGIDRLIGTALMLRGDGPLVHFRSAASDEHCQRVIDTLAAVESCVEPVETMLQREIAYCQRMYGWQTRFGHLIAWLVVGPPHTWTPYENMHTAENRRRAIQRLLMTEFAIRRHEIASGALPDSLESLAPYLPELPIDPFTGQSFIYRKTGDTFLLYSVGIDTQDDGGRFDTLKASASQAGLDLDAQTVLRNEHMYAR
jgi:hypothetical protein